jgi:hypothetical protein
MSKTFSQADVASHNKPNDLYVTIDDDVYDLTQFQDEHPGMRSLSHQFVSQGHTTDLALQAERRSSLGSPARTPRSNSGNTTTKASSRNTNRNFMSAP